MPHALKLDKKHRKDGLALLLVHVQPADDLPAFVLQRFPQTEAPVVGENTIPIGPKAPFKIPRCALIGIDGKVLAEGMRREVGKEIDRLIPQELKRRRKGWGASPGIARGRALLYFEGRLAAAKKHFAGLQPTASAREDLRKARAELQRRFDHELDRLAHFRESGAWHRARELGRRLLESVRGELEWEVKVEVALEPLLTPEAEAQIALDERFEKLQRALRKRRPKPGDLKRIDALIAKQEAGPVVQRIRAWRDALARALQG